MIRFVAIAILVIFVSGARADDWPQFLGPHRDGVSAEKGLADAWPAAGPPVLWKRDVGEGFSGPVVAGERLIVFHRVGGNEVVDCLAAATGKPHWQFTYPTGYADALGKGDGPRSTPAIAGKRVVTLGAEGTLHCLDLEDGTKVWERRLLTEYKVPRSYFGVGTSPIVDGDLVLVNVGGKKAGIVAFHLKDGKEAWRATDDGPSYASPVVTTAGGQRVAVFFTRTGADVLDARSGKVHYRQRWRAAYDASVNAATPLVIGDRLFFSASYETGALLLKLRPDGSAEELWQDEALMSNHYNTCIYADGHLYGIHGRQEVGPELRCVDLKTRKVAWSEKRFGCATMILAEGRLIALTEAGELMLIEATPAAYREKARARVFDAGPCRAQIALAGGRLFARDQKKLACFNLAK